MGCVQTHDSLSPENLGRSSRTLIKTNRGRRYAEVGESNRFHGYAFKDNTGKQVKHELIIDRETGWPVATVQRFESVANDQATATSNKVSSDLRKAKKSSEIIVRDFAMKEFRNYYINTLGEKTGKKAFDQFRKSNPEKRLRGLRMRPRSKYIRVDTMGLVKIKLGKSKTYENTNYMIGGPKTKVYIKRITGESLVSFQEARADDIKKMNDARDVLRRYGSIFSKDFNESITREQARAYLSKLRSTDCHVRRVDVAGEDDGIVLLTEYTVNELDRALKDHKLDHEEIYLLHNQTFSGVDRNKRLNLFRRNLERMYVHDPLLLKLKGFEELMTDTGTRYLLASVRRENPNVIQADDEAFDLLVNLTYEEALQRDWDDSELDKIYHTYRCSGKRSQKVWAAMEGYDVRDMPRYPSEEEVDYYFPGDNIPVDYAGDQFVGESRGMIVPMADYDEMTMPIGGLTI